MNAVYIFKALADETRLRIINLLLRHELNVNEIAAILEMGQPRISRHLKILADCGLITARRDGLWMFYTLTSDPGLLQWFKASGFLLVSLPTVELDRQQRERIISQRTQETRQLFNTLAGHWEKIKGDLFGELDLNNEIVAAVPRCRTILDIGCGTGDLLRLLAGQADKAIGVDNSPRMLEQAGRALQTAAAKIDLRLGNIEHLPLGDREADTAVINMVLHHFESPLPILKEANRVLANNGTLILADFHKHAQEVMRTRYGDRRLGFQPAELENGFRENGFRIKTRKQFSLAGGLEILFYQTIKEEK